MNEYNYDYLGMNGIIPDSVLNFMNSVPQNMMNKQNMNYVNNNLFNPTDGFIKGNMFKDLYNSYKNYKPTNLNPKNEKEAMLWSFLQYKFALHDLNLYLDVYPTDTNVLNSYKQYLNIMNETMNEYEKKYGPLTCSSIYSFGNDWKWDNSPWPWEVM